MVKVKKVRTLCGQQWKTEKWKLCGGNGEKEKCEKFVKTKVKGEKWKLCVDNGEREKGQNCK